MIAAIDECALTVFSGGANNTAFATVFKKRFF
jgi:hypothetical protein